MAKDVEVKSHLPERIDVVAAEPGSIDGKNGEHVWRFSALGPGEKRSIVLAYRVKPGVAAGTNLQIENRFSYKDQLGNSY
jgi:predicted secreted protein